MSKKTNSIYVKTQDGCAVVEVKNVYLDASQKKFSIVGHFIGEFDNPEYARLLECENCEAENDCKDCKDGNCYQHCWDKKIGDCFDSDFCDECEFENIVEKRMMLLARYNYEFEVLYELKKFADAIESQSKIYRFSERLYKHDLLDIAMKNGISKEEKFIQIQPRNSFGKIKNRMITTYDGTASIEIKEQWFLISPEFDFQTNKQNLVFRDEQGKFIFQFEL